MGKPERQPPVKGGASRPPTAADRAPFKPTGSTAAAVVSNGGGVLDRSKCELASRKGDDLKTAIYSCACGAQLTGFTAWRNHLKKAKKFRKCKSRVHAPHPRSSPCHPHRRRTADSLPPPDGSSNGPPVPPVRMAVKEEGAKVYQKRRLSMRPADQAAPVQR